ncbi:MAG: YwiC-like family protein [Anaerolineales bacterium]|nr:YwiC-like family protein [Anaerolineales bacterium]
MAVNRPRLRPIALPTEHGGWSLILEPIALGLWVAPSWAGLLLGVAAFSLFLTRHPLQLAYRDTQRGKRHSRTVWAMRFAAGYGTVALVAGLLACIVTDHSFWQTLILALPLVGVQLYYDLQRRGRELIPEILGAMALSLVAPTIALADNWSLGAAGALWLVLLARIIGTILYVRARLRLERGEQPSPMPTHIAHGVGLAAVMALVLIGEVQWLAAVAIGVLLLRALYGLSKWRKPAPRAAIIGVQEVVFGVITVTLVALSYTALR